MLAAWAFYLSSSQVYLRLENAKTHAPLFWLKVRGNDAFSLSYRHPTDGTVYVEHYRIMKGKAFELTGLTFRSSHERGHSRYGIPKNLSNGWRTFQGLHEIKKDIPFVVDSVTRNGYALLIHGKKYFLTRFTRPGTSVVFRVDRRRQFVVFVWKIEEWLR